MSRLKAKKKAQNRRFTIQLFIVGFFILALLGTAITWIYFKSTYDKNTFCEKEVKLTTTAIIIDRTGDFSLNHIRSIKEIIDFEIEKLSLGDRLSLYAIDPVKFKGLSEVLFEKCKPKTGSQVNKFVENKRMLETRFVKEFKEPVQSISQDVIDGNDGASSPIIEGIFDVISKINLENNSSISRLVIISDLLQHSNIMTMYKGSINNIENLPRVKRIIPDLGGVEVKVFWILRDNTKEERLQSKELLAWWDSFFEHSLASDYSIEKVR